MEKISESFELLLLIFDSYFYKILTFSLNKFKPDLIIASSPQILVSFCGLIIAKVFKKPFIFEVRDLWPQVLIDLGGQDPKNIFIRALSFIEYLLYREADSVIVLAKGSKKYVRAKGAKNIVWLPNGPDLKKFKNISNYINSENFNYANPFILIYAGAHGKANDLENVIKVSKYFKKLSY